MKAVGITTALSMMLLASSSVVALAVGDPNVDTGVGSSSSRGMFGYSNNADTDPRYATDPNSYGVYRDAYGALRDSGMIPDNLTTRVNEMIPSKQDAMRGPMPGGGAPGGLATGGLGGFGGFPGFPGFGLGGLGGFPFGAGGLTSAGFGAFGNSGFGGPFTNTFNPFNGNPFFTGPGPGGSSPFNNNFPADTRTVDNSTPGQTSRTTIGDNPFGPQTTTTRSTPGDGSTVTRQQTQTLGGPSFEHTQIAQNTGTGGTGTGGTGTGDTGTSGTGTGSGTGTNGTGTNTGSSGMSFQSDDDNMAPGEVRQEQFRAVFPPNAPVNNRQNVPQNTGNIGSGAAGPESFGGERAGFFGNNSSVGNFGPNVATPSTFGGERAGFFGNPNVQGNQVGTGFGGFGGGGVGGLSSIGAASGNRGNIGGTSGSGGSATNGGGSGSNGMASSVDASGMDATGFSLNRFGGPVQAPVPQGTGVGGGGLAAGALPGGVKQPEDLQIGSSFAAGDGLQINSDTETDLKLKSMQIPPQLMLGKIIGSMRYENGDIATFGTKGTLIMSPDNSGTITFNSGESMTLRNVGPVLRRIALRSQFLL